MSRTQLETGTWCFAALLAASVLSPTVDAQVRSRAGDVQPVPDYEVRLTELLGKVVESDGTVHYAKLRGEHNVEFRRILKAIETFDGALGTDAEKKAFWINAYNVQMLQNVVENPGFDDIIADGKADLFFKTPVLTAGVAASLDQIEHEILRRVDPSSALGRLAVEKLDPRIHVALNCAAVSCPALRPAAFSAGKLDKQLDEAMRRFANSDRHFRTEGKSVVVSSLLQWFASDWDSTGKAGDLILRHMDANRKDFDRLSVYLHGATAKELAEMEATVFEYDWKLNDAGLR